ncbi:hypothetical protein BASA83_009705 [Batrachochytrium salamandrivorans]|nr:hypothetical protein BASA83_009705 [Batrachochytrium salamandrivorans]
MQIPSQEFPSTFDISDYDCPLAVLPKILHSATLSGNPVVQTFMVSTELPLNTVATGMLDVFCRKRTATLFVFKSLALYCLLFVIRDRGQDRDHENLNSFPQSHHTQHSSGGKDVASQTSSTPGSISSA